MLSSWRLGVDARFGLDPDRIAARNPRAVVCRITGFGSRGPYAHYPAWDGIVAAKAGRMLEFCGLVGGARPAYAAVPVAGWCASQLALHGILAALLDRERTGRGRRVETSLVQALGIYDLVNWLPGYTMMLRVADVPYLPYTNACTKDGVWLQFAQLSPAQFRAFIRDLALDEIWGDPRFRHAPALRDPEQMRALRAIVLARVREKTYADWMSIFDADSDIAVERFRTPAEAMEHPQIVHNGDVVEHDDPEVGRLRELGPLIRFSATPVPPRARGERRAGGAARRLAGPASRGRAARGPRPRSAPRAGRSAGARAGHLGGDPAGGDAARRARRARDQDRADRRRALPPGEARSAVAEDRAGQAEPRPRPQAPGGARDRARAGAPRGSVAAQLPAAACPSGSGSTIRHCAGSTRG